jgi:D-alanyl-D-alanine carboxypeptidase
MRTSTRALVALTCLAAVTGTIPSAAAAAPPGVAPETRCTTEPTDPTTLPPLSGAKLSAAIAGLPDDEISGAIVQVRGSAGCWQGTSGVANVHTGQSVPQDGRFRIGSMTKMFTAVVALQLVAEGRLDLDQSVRHYLPDLLPAGYPAITVRQVLTYTSGINGTDVPHKDPDWFLVHRYDHWEPGSQLDLTKPPAFTPGTKQRYGNADYIVAGLLIEKVTGRTWEREATDRIIRPLRLTGTTAPADDPRIRGPHAHGYEALSSANGTTRWVDITQANPSLQWSAAAIISTASDLDRFLVAVFTGQLMPAAQLDLMFTVPDVPTWDADDNPANDEPATFAIGLNRLKIGGLTLWGKTGDRPGYNNGIGATRDLSRRLTYSVNTLHMGGEFPAAVQRIITATYL